MNMNPFAVSGWMRSNKASRIFLTVMLPVILMPAFLVSLNCCAQAYEECRYRVWEVWYL